MKKIFIILLLFSLLLITSCKKDELDLKDYHVNDTLDSVIDETVNVVLLYGQSNATGCSNMYYLNEKDPDNYNKALKGFDNVYINYICEGGSNSSNSTFIKCSLGEGANNQYFGPEIGISLKYEQNNKKCFIIKYTWGGSVLDKEWLNGNYKRGDLYNEAVSFTIASLDYLLSKGYKIIIDGICWMQGESDSMEPLSKRYYKNTTSLVNYLREDLKKYQSPIKFIDAGISDSFFWKEYKKINEVKKEYSELDINNYYFSTIDHGLHVDEEPTDNPDIAHYDSLSELQLGLLFGDYLLNK